MPVKKIARQMDLTDKAMEYHITKSLEMLRQHRDRSGQYIFTIPEKSWWTYHVHFLTPERSFAFPDMKVYKARCFYQ